VFAQNVPGAVAQGGNINIALPHGLDGKFVRVGFNGTNPEGNGFLSLAEVQVMGGQLPNVARNPLAVASQSSTGFGGDAARAIDGNTDGNYGSNSVTHTNSDTNAFWEVNLGKDFGVDEVILFNRTDCCGDRLSNFRVSIFNDGNEVYGENFLGIAPTQLRFDVPNLVGDRVRVQLNGTNFLSLAEVQVFGAEIPEPTTGLLGLIGVAALARRRRAA
jgi:hypothetical protein